LITGPDRCCLLHCVMRGNALAAFEAAANHIYPERSVQMQKRWMCRSLQKRAEWSIRDHVARIVEINDHMPLCPHVHGQEPAATKLPDDELMDVLEFGCPASLQKQMILQDFEPVTRSTAEFVPFCEQIKRTEDGPEPIKKAQEKSSNKGKKVNSPSNSVIHTRID
jgi:hypothetical protein